MQCGMTECGVGGGGWKGVKVGWKWGGQWAEWVESGRCNTTKCFGLPKVGTWTISVFSPTYIRVGGCLWPGDASEGPDCGFIEGASETIQIRGSWDWRRYQIQVINLPGKT